jgi:hypothetical protein
MSSGLAYPNYVADKYGPRWGPTNLPASPSFAPVGGFHTYAPGSKLDPHPWALPQNQLLRFKQGSGYYTVPGTGAPATGTTVTKSTGGGATIDSLIKQIYGTIESPADQEARVNREINAQMAAQQKMIDDMYARQRADAMAQMQGQSLAGQAAAAMSKDLFGAVGGEFNAAAGEISGLSHALSKNAAGATAGDVSAANAGLASLGNAPVAEGGTFGVGGETQRGVEDYRAGTLGSQMFKTQGEAANFGLAGMIGSDAQRVTEEASATLMNSMKQINDNESQAINSLAAGRLDLYHQYMSDANDARVKSLTLVQGLIAQKQANQQAVAKLNAQAARDAITARQAQQRIGISAQNAATSAYNAKVGAKYKAAQVDLASGRLTLAQSVADARNKLAQANYMRQALKDQVANGAIDVNRSRALGHVVDKQGNPVLDANKKWIPSSYLDKATAAKPPSATTAMKAHDYIQTAFYGYKTVGAHPATKTRAGSPGRRVPAWQAPGFDPQDPKTWGKGFETYPKALAQLTRMGYKRDQARNMLNELWERGNQGRPIFSTEEQAALRKHFGNSEYERMVVMIRRALDKGNDQVADNWIAQMLSGQKFSTSYNTGYVPRPANP